MAHSAQGKRCTECHSVIHREDCPTMRPRLTPEQLAQTAQILAMAQMLKTALAVEDSAWASAIDAANAHRPIDALTYALADILDFPRCKVTARGLIDYAERLAAIEGVTARELVHV